MSEKYVSLTPESAQRLSDVIVRRRVEMGMRSARSLGEEAGLDYRTVSNLESCRRDIVSRTTLAVLELKLGWPSGYLLGVIRAKGRQTAELKVPGGASEEAVERARKIAQAAFDAAIRSME